MPWPLQSLLLVGSGHAPGRSVGRLDFSNEQPAGDTARSGPVEPLESLSSAEHRNGRLTPAAAAHVLSGSRTLDAPEVTAKRPRQRPVVEDQFMPDCAEVAVQGLVPYPEACGVVAQDAWVQAPGGQDDLPLSQNQPTFAPCAHVPLRFEFLDGRAECWRISGNNQRRSSRPSAASSHGSAISTSWYESSL